MTDQNTDWKLPGINSLSLLILAAFPALFLVAALFVYPTADDFDYGLHYINSGLWPTVKSFYMRWSGRYFATAAISFLGSHSDNLLLYRALPFIFVSAFCLTLYGILRELNEDKRRLPNALLALGGTAVFLTHYISLSQGLYWLSGSVTFMSGIVCSVMAAYFLLCLARRGGLLNALAAGLSMIVGIGANELSAMTLVLAALLGMVWAWDHKSPRRGVFTLLFLVAAICLLLSFFAPGNFARSGMDDSFAQSRGLRLVLKALGVTLTDGAWTPFRYLFSSAVIPFLAMLALTLRTSRPLWLFPRLGLKKNVLISVGFAMALVLSDFFVGYLAAGKFPYSRMRNVIYFDSLAGILLVALTCLPWLREKLTLAMARSPRISPAAIFILLILALSVQKNTFLTVRNLVSGDLRSYAQEKAERNVLAERSPGQELVVEPLSVEPFPVFFRDISENPSYWVNRHFAHYWGLASIRVGQ